MTIATLLYLRAEGESGINTTFAGLPIVVEYPAGSTREIKNDKGVTVYKGKMHNAYGYIQNTKGRDGDEVDVFLGPVQNATHVYVAHMKDLGPDVNEREDEDKVMLGFTNYQSAKICFCLHYPHEWLEGMTVLPLATFKEKLQSAAQPYRRKKLHAGGPGSGRHPEPGIEEDYFTRQDRMKKERELSRTQGVAWRSSYTGINVGKSGRSAGKAGWHVYDRTGKLVGGPYETKQQAKNEHFDLDRPKIKLHASFVS